jgi:hypothetical protein
MKNGEFHGTIRAGNEDLSIEKWESHLFLLEIFRKAEICRKLKYDLEWFKWESMVWNGFRGIALTPRLNGGVRCQFPIIDAEKS